jgi:PleD family two-component response regulator
MAKRILSLATDSSLLTLRAMILQAAGYEVHSATNLLQVIEAYHSGDFDLILIGHTINEKEKRRIATKLRELGTNGSVLELCLISPEIPNVDYWIIESGPEVLLDKIQEILADNDPETKRKPQKSRRI